MEANMKPKYFELYELLPQNFYINYKNLNNIWFVFDGRILETIDRLRIRYGKLIANDWIWGGQNQYRGWRPPNCDVGAKLSQHRFGRAIDLIPKEVDVIEIIEDIKNNYESDDTFRYITCIEDNIGWLHFDVRNHNKYKNSLLIV
jgi:hypothetical protein